MRIRLAAAAALFAIPAAARVPVVVTDIPPVHSLVARVMGDLGQPVLLLGAGADAHDYQMRPSDAGALADADAVFWIGPEMTPWLERALEGGDASRAVSLLHAPGTYTQPFAGGAEAQHDSGDDHGATDPHAFLDPGNAILWLGLIADRLAALDPEHGATYHARADAAAISVAATDHAIRARLAPFAAKPVIVYHEAFGYFAAHYGLHVAGSVALGDAADPGAARLSDIRAKLGHVACIFPEAGHDPKLIGTLAEGTGARIGGALDPEGRGLPPGPGLYEALLNGVADALLACLAPD